MRLRLLLPLIVFVLPGLLSPSSAFARPKMLIGLQDDPSLRWSSDRAAAFRLAQRAHAGIVRTTAYWSPVPPTRPKNPANPFDRAYRLSDLDEFVGNAGLHGMEVML